MVIIAIEGCDGSGKSTISAMLSKRMPSSKVIEQSKRVDFLPDLRSFLDGQVDNLVLARLVYFLGTNQLSSNEAAENEKKGIDTILVRSIYSTKAYHFAYDDLYDGHANAPVIGNIVAAAEKSLVHPDIVVFLHVAGEERDKRIVRREATENSSLDWDSKTMAFIDSEFRKYAKELRESGKAFVIELDNTNLTPEETVDRIASEIALYKARAIKRRERL